MIFSMIIDITNFDLYSTKELEDRYIEFTPTQSFNINFDAMDIF